MWVKVPTRLKFRRIMNKKTLKILEYNRITDALKEKASSPLGKEECNSLKPMTNADDINTAQEETEAAVGRLLRNSRVTFQGNFSLKRTLHDLSIGMALSQGELLRIAGLCECADRVKTYGAKEHESDEGDCLTERFEALCPLKSLADTIRAAIISEDEMADDASSELKKIRKSKITTGEKIHSQLNSMVNSTYRTYLQDTVITMRNNRYCIPVKAEYKGQVGGMVHDQSKAGSTYFIEPAAVVELNNRLQELEIEEKKEIERILRELSLKAAEYVDEIKSNQEILTNLDFIFAKGYLALDMNGSRPVFEEGGNINIRKARHPLIDSSKVVPIDIKLGEDYDLLIVTGPNTGGKTVSLKTTGLLCAMGQSGLQIPAANGSTLRIFNDIFADIGDEQSIEQSLSTFSAHMTNIVSIIKRADSNCLCLFDELCAGTDPTEGAALAIAILKDLHDKGVLTMATTHYSELKVFALSAYRVENACCEFDVTTLSPTYRLLIGIPGKSNAFAISSKLGLSKNIIENAKNEITEEKISFEDLISDLESSKVSIENERISIEKYRSEIEQLKEKADEKQERLEEQKARILREANEEARAILEEAKEEADKAIKLYMKGTDIKEMEEMRSSLRGKINERGDDIRKNTKSAAKAVGKKLTAADLKKGMSVQIVSMGMKGTVHTLPDASGFLKVNCGIMQTKASIDDLIIIEEPTGNTGKGNTKAYTGHGLSKASTISPELNLLGKNSDEAIAELDKYIDDAYLSHLHQVRIVHGKGSGVLRDAVARYLKKQPHVKSFHLGEYGEGDSGVTIVEF